MAFWAWGGLWVLWPGDWNRGESSLLVLNPDLMELILESPGTRLLRRESSFLIEPVEGQSRQIAPVHVSRIIAGRGILLSSGAMRLAAEAGIPLLLVDGQGQPQARLWSPQYGSIARIRRGQVAFAEGRAGMQWVAEVVAKRLRGSARLLAETKPPINAACPPAIELLHRQALRLEQLKAEPEEAVWRDRLRGWEGSAIRAYFEAMNTLLPPGWNMRGRSRRPAQDPFNCLLNYLYGMLYGYLEGDLIRAGIDPYMGVLHEDVHNRPVLVYDLIEAYRTWAERVALDLARRHPTPPADWFQHREGGWWLQGPGKAVVIEAMRQDLQAIPAPHKRSRRQRMQAACHALARRMVAARERQGHE